MGRVIEKALYTAFPGFVRPCLKEVIDNNKYMTKKTANFLLNGFEKRLQRERLLSYPYFILIDPTNICNLRCPLCPTWQDVKSRPKGKMEIRRFQKIMEEVGPYLFAVYFCNWGEPLINPDFVDMIAKSKKYNLVACFSTNLNLLPGDSAKRLVDSGIDIIVISLDGASQETYSRYRVGGDISAVYNNLDRLLSYRTRATGFPLIVWQFIVNKYNEHEIESAAAIAREMGIMFMPAMMRTSMGKELLLPLHERVKDMKEWRPANLKYYRYNYEINPGTRTSQKSCKWLWTSSVVNWDGSISPCCAVFERTWDFGSCYSNLPNSRTFHQAWNSPRYILARKLVAAFMKEGQKTDPLVHHAEKEGLICAKCIRYGFLED
jgi:MoaA/NifB/PqqE/SkfB family radical SAM enzyme